MQLSTGGKLLELTIDGLNKDLEFRDSNLAERFGRSALELQKLYIGNVRQTKKETRELLAQMVQTMLSGDNTPPKLGLFNLGFDASEGEAILEKIVDKQFDGFIELRLDQNPEFWQVDSCCF